MNAKKSFFNKKIFVHNLIQALPIMLLMAAFLLLYTISALNSELHLFEYENLSLKEETFRIQHSLFNYSSIVIFKFMLTCYSFVCGIFVFRYFYNKKLCATIHALPLTRSCMYITNLLSGLAILILPILLSGGILAAYIGILGYSVTHIPLWMLIFSGYCLIFYALAVLTAMLTGLLTATPVVYFFFNFGIIITQYIFAIFTSNFYFGVDPYDMNIKHLILTPFAYLYSKLHALDYSSNVIGFEKDGVNGIIIYTIVSIVLFIIGFFLYKMRNLETQGDPIVTKRLQPLFHYTGTVLGASVLTLILFAIFFYDYETYYVTKTGLVTITILFLICSVLFYYVIRMLLQKTVHIFKGSAKGIIIYCIAALVSILLISIDIFGIETKLPDLDNIERVTLYFDSYDKDYENKEHIEQLRDIHQMVITEKEAIISDLEKHPTESYTSHFDLTYTLKDGSTLTRSYTLGYHNETESKPLEIVTTLMNFISNKDLMLEEIETFKKNNPYIYIYDNFYESIEEKDIYGNVVVTTQSSGSIDVREKDYDAFFEALKKDIQEGTVKYEVGTYNNVEGFHVDISAEFLLSDYMYFSRYYVITKDCKNSYPYLLQLFKKYQENEPLY